MAGPWYVRSTNASSGDGTSWDLAVKTLAEAFTLVSAGDIIYVSQDHSESTAAAITFTSPGTAASPCKIICINDSTGALATTAIIATSTAATYSCNINGFAYFYGVNFNIFGSILCISAAPFFISFEECSLNIKRTFAGNHIILGSGSAVGDDQGVDFINTDVSVVDTNNNSITIRGCVFSWKGGTVNYGTGTVIPKYLITLGVAFPSIISISGVDLSLLTSSQYLFKQAAVTALIHMQHCKFGASTPVIFDTAIPSDGGSSFYLDQCTSSDPSYGPMSNSYTYQGSVKTDTAKYRTGGASDGTSYSLMMTANTTGVSFVSPLVTRPIPKAIDTIGSEVTVTAHIAMEEGATPLTESKCWMEVEYMGTSGSMLTSFLTDNYSNVISESSTAQETSTETWTGFTGTPVKQKLSVAFTPQEKGFYMVRIYLARVSAETTAPPVYVCPKLVVS